MKSSDVGRKSIMGENQFDRIAKTKTHMRCSQKNQREL